MLSAKKWLALSVLLTSSVLFLLTLTNYMVDPYGFDKERSKNTNFTTPFKANIVSHSDFDAMLLGTSTTGVMDPTVVDSYLKTHSFNLSYPSSNTQIQNRFFKYAHHFNPKIKYLIYGVDFGSFNAKRHHKKHFVEFYDQEEKIEHKEKLSSFDLYFNFNTFTSSVEAIFNGLLQEEKLEPQYIRATGMLDYVDNIQELEKGTYDLERKMKQSIQVFFQNEGIYQDYEFSQVLFDEFKDTLAFCHKNNIKVLVYIPPVHSDHFDALAEAGYFEKFEAFKRELVKVTDYVDFTGHNALSSNQNNYWDATHLRKEMTETIIKRLLEEKGVGTLVTQENIEAHLSKLRAELKSYDLESVLAEKFK